MKQERGKPSKFRHKGKVNFTYDYDGKKINTLRKRAISAKLNKVYIRPNSKISSEIITQGSTKASTTNTNSRLFGGRSASATNRKN